VVSSERAAAAELRDRLVGEPADRRERLLLDLVRARVAAVLGGGSPVAIRADRPFRALGIKRDARERLSRELSDAVGLALPSTLLFDHPSPLAVARYLLERLTGEPSPAATAARPVPVDPDDPIAIVGMACRYAGGVGSPEQLWELVAAGGDAVTRFPADRGWDLPRLYDPDPDHPGTSYTREGAFLADVADFDAAFFGIAPREAAVMDPQQRILLETTWEALERAGIDPTALAGTTTGAFIGSNYQDYRTRFASIPPASEGYFITGNAASVLSGRLAYVLGWHGPAVTVDTACSSSLVALHQAGQALRAGECDLAVAGGVAVLCSPEAFVDFGRKHVLSVDGRCKAFAEDADGTGWGEGVGVLLLERLSDARRHGRRVLAVVRGSAVNSNGASNGLTAPNGPSQERVIRQALASAGVSGAEVDAVEAHGTGTRLGDPIEAHAVLATYGRDRGDGGPVWLGSVKSNIAHTQAASGIAGVIKMVEAMRHRVLPRTLHVTAPSQPSRQVDWDTGAVALLTESRDWPATSHPRRAGVSSFGVSGTNAHVIVEEPPFDAGAPADPGTPPAVVPWVLSARTADALRAQASRLAARVRQDPGPAPADVGFSLATSRSVFEHRAVVLGGEAGELLAGLAAITRDEPVPQLVRGVAAESDGAPVFVFPGQGSQWVGMGRELLAASPVFAGAMSDCQAALESFVDWDLPGVLADPDALTRVDVLQPVLWAVMVALAQVWRSSGVEPAAVVGHSQGEVAAACVAGALSLPDAARVVALRSRALVEHATPGGMVSVVAPVERVRELLAPWGDRLSVAAVNGPASVAVAGEHGALEELERALAARQVMRWRVPGVDFVAHSHHAERLAAALDRALAPIRPTRASVPLYSTVDGDWSDGTGLDGRYWYRNLRETVGFMAAVEALAAHGHTTFVEISPHPVLAPAVSETLGDRCDRLVVAGTLRRGDGGLRRLHASLAEVFVTGTPVRWAAAFHGSGATRVDLPPYPFQRQRYWPDETGSPDSAAAGPVPAGSAAETAFWAAVDRQDLEALSAALRLDPARRSAWQDVLPHLAGWHRRSRTEATLDELRYRITWRAVTAHPAGLSGSWLAVLPAGAAGDPWVSELLSGLRRQGGDVVPVEAPAGVRRDDLRELLRTGTGGDRPAGVLSLLALDEGPDPAWPGLPAGLTGTLGLIQALGDLDSTAPLWLLSRQAVSVGGSDLLARPVQALTWGMGRVVGLEQPRRWGGLVDLPDTLDDGVVGRLAAVLAAGDEDQVAVRDAGVFGRRLVRARCADEADRPARGWRPRPDGTVLITGGGGVQAGHVARELARDGAGHLLLAARRGMATAGMPERVAELEALGARVTVARCDVRDREQLRAALALVPEQLPLTAVIHTAGVGRLQPLTDTTVADLAEVVEAKFAGARLLHELTRDRELDAFVLFSAISATWGSGGQGAYGAGNAYLEALAEHRRGQGLPATAVAWGGWAGGGMAVRDAGEAALRRRGLPWGAWTEAGLTEQEAADETLRGWGVQLMPPELLLAALRQALDRDETLVTIATVDWRQFVTGFTAARPRPLLHDLPDARQAVEALAAGEPDAGAGGDAEAGAEARTDRTGPPLAQRLPAMSRHERDHALVELVRTQVAAVLGHQSPGSVELEQTFLDMGVDSVTAVQLRNRIGAASGLRLPATVIFDHPTVKEVAAFLHGKLVPEAAAAPPAPDRAETADPGGGDDLEHAGLDEVLEILDSELDRP
jgi:polyketide synthase 7